VSADAGVVVGAGAADALVDAAGLVGALAVGFCPHGPAVQWCAELGVFQWCAELTVSQWAEGRLPASSGEPIQAMAAEGIPTAPAATTAMAIGR
jgi:hypothetical protein